MVLAVLPTGAFAAVDAGGNVIFGEDFDWEHYDWSEYDWNSDPLEEESARSRMPLWAQLDYNKAKNEYSSSEIDMRLKSAAVQAAGDTGSTTEFLISTAAQLKELADYVNAGKTDFSAAHYKQTADISLSAYNTGDGWTP